MTISKTIAAAAARLFPILPTPSRQSITADTVRDLLRKDSK